MGKETYTLEDAVNIMCALAREPKIDDIMFVSIVNTMIDAYVSTHDITHDELFEMLQVSSKFINSILKGGF